MDKLDTRKEALLATIVREHSRTAEPIASDDLKRAFGISAATIRNEMAMLEKEGYLKQPHTSAGRIPTEKGYRYYVSNCLEKREIKSDLSAFRSTFENTEEGNDKLKQIARYLAEDLSQGVFIGFDDGSYYTGLSQLFSQPEFDSVDLVRNLSGIIDNLDAVMEGLFETATTGVQIYVGSENPFGDQCGTVLLKAPDHPMLGVLGPMRMDYDRIVSLMKEIEEVLN